MKKYFWKLQIAFFFAVIIFFVQTSANGWWLDYYIDEPTYNGGWSCNTYQTPTLTPRTIDLQQELNNHGWNGNRYDSEAWPADFLDVNEALPSENPLDYQYADYRTLTVFAGHGSFEWDPYAQDAFGTIVFATNRGTQSCGIRFNDMELGAGSGAYNLYAVFSSCCTLRNYIPQGDWNNKQVFGYRSPLHTSGSGSLSSFFTDTLNNGQTNVNSWLENSINYWGGPMASTIVYSFGTTLDEASNVANTCKLGTVGDSSYQQLCLYNRTQPFDWYIYYYLNDEYGCGA